MSGDEPAHDTLMELILQMDERQQRLFACDCAERMIPTWEQKRQDGKRLRAVLQVARDYANGKAGKSDLDRAIESVRRMPSDFMAPYMSVIPHVISFTAAHSHNHIWWPDEGW